MADPRPAPDSPSALQRAVDVLRAGGLVAFPTETVYGLGADARQAAAVQKIFAAKGRPATNPLIVHVADVQTARRYTTHWTSAAQTLAQRFWPGPLTLVLPRSDVIVDQVSAGLKTVGLRVPDHPLALELLRALDGPVAAPSANRSNHISPTTARHVLDELGDAVDLILDGGPCRVGIESTVLDLSGAAPRLLRPGGISQAQIEALIGPVQALAQAVEAHQPALSPGQHRRHYAPCAPASCLSRDEFNSLPRDARGRLRLGPVEAPAWDGFTVTLPDTPEQYARHFYAVLRTLDQMNPPAILIELPPDLPAWAALRDRIRRATHSGPSDPN